VVSYISTATKSIMRFLYPFSQSLPHANEMKLFQYILCV
jgi:hypothetical protein